ncbi:hypothetical protein FHX82_005199 [Amycolatopsis bartoniae]|uniref:Uncharacterized protein n=1 Tax=Amycolatopsis bartoniae TaxID=941986 RepID=A0A8H9IM93_9PSEU|nr:hypothetical protein [Amycolatopsis bartoniae]MBB2938123.1 hypothetical protein [Amycolatopsis bartoniae]TVT01267.1 hypothetical protein FNH07_29920 [Amycolatopsis bartoniae]GHF32829.1 hypothetical protein GCM10017566_01770 [Amycolatopsis bartoniae]
MAKLTREEMIQLVEKVWQGEAPEEEQDRWIEEIRSTTGNPHVLRLIQNEEGLTAEQVVDKALEYKPFQL